MSDAVLWPRARARKLSEVEAGSLTLRKSGYGASFGWALPRGDRMRIVQLLPAHPEGGGCAYLEVLPADPIPVVMDLGRDWIVSMSTLPDDVGFGFPTKNIAPSPLVLCGERVLLPVAHSGGGGYGLLDLETWSFDNPPSPDAVYSTRWSLCRRDPNGPWPLAGAPPILTSAPEERDH